MNLADLRKEYTLESLEVNDVATDPIEQFKKWLEEAMKSGLPEPTAMHLATVAANGQPSGRIVLLKGVDHGFLFFTNYQSRKGQELAERPLAALTFHWAELERQVRIEGTVVQTDRATSDAYFDSRPQGSRIGAIASPQSQPIESREWLETRMAELAAQYEGQNPPRPHHWGGYRLLPTRIEFWQGRPSRLHDRIAYTLQADHQWHIERLAP